MNEIVKIHNDFTNTRLSNLTAKELDLLMAICVKVKNQQDNVISIKFDELQRLSNYKQYNLNDLRKDLTKMHQNLIKMFIVTYKDNDGAEVTESLFRQFRKYDNYLKVQISDKLLYLLNDLTSNFTTFELQEFVSLQSKYSKRLYKLLKQYKSTGQYAVSKNMLYEQLNVPQNYRMCDFKIRVLNPALEECKIYFKNLSVSVEKGGRGSAVQGFVFNFDCTQQATKNIKSIKTNKTMTKNKFNQFENKQSYDIENLEKQLLSN